MTRSFPLASKFQLFIISNPTEIPYTSLSNLEAIDENGSMIWQAESPKTPHDAYYDIAFDYEEEILIAYSSNSYTYTINPRTGKTIHYSLVK